MRTHYDWVYLAPHLDDAALSCGAQIAMHTRAGASVLVVTVMAGDPPPETQASEYVESLHARWQLAADAAAQRRAEDLAACRVLGADALHWNVPDCIYRTDAASGAPFYVSDADIFGEIAPPELGLVAQLAADLARLPAWERMVTPLTVGHHVDHQLVRLAAEQCWGASRLDYYEDYPYAQQEGAVEAVLAAMPGDWRAEVITVDAAAIQAKIEAIAAYRSQLSTFWADRRNLEAEVGGFIRQAGGERVWQQTRGATA